MNTNNTTDNSDPNGLTLNNNNMQQASLLQFAKNQPLQFSYGFNMNTQFAPGAVAQLIPPNTNTTFPTQFTPGVQQIRPIQTTQPPSFVQGNTSGIPQISSPLPSPTTPTSIPITQQQQPQQTVQISSTTSSSSGASSITTTATKSKASSRQQQQQQDASNQDSSFKSIFGKYQKKRSRNQMYNGNGTTDGSSSDLEEKFDFLTQIISLQATKIRRLENRLKAIEEILPDYGSFTEQEKLRLTQNQPSSTTGDATAGGDPNKKEKRPKTEYQIFMSEEIPRIRSQNPDIPQKEAFSVAAKNWSLKKESDQKLREANKATPGEHAGIPVYLQHLVEQQQQIQQNQQQQQQQQQQ